MICDLFYWKKKIKNMIHKKKITLSKNIFYTLPFTIFAKFCPKAYFLYYFIYFLGLDEPNLSPTLSLKGSVPPN